MIDMFPLTGGCHYTFDCHKYLSQCQICPLLQSNHIKDAALANWRQRAHAFSRMSVHFIAYSSWLEHNIRNSALRFGNPVYPARLPVDPVIFQKSDKMPARRRLGLPQDKKIIYFGAHSLQDPRKGFDYFQKALQILKQSSPPELAEKILLVFASSDAQDGMPDIPFSFQHLGFLKSPEELACSYQACDVYACSSIQDAGPLMINEALMCGIPVVAFEMGAALDLVKNGKTGYRAALRNSAEFARGLEKVLTKSEAQYQRMSSECRDMALKYCHPQVYVESMLKIISKILPLRRQKMALDSHRGKYAVIA
jgi:glycosyltransferase involved in cell wall biosynthesis